MNTLEIKQKLIELNACSDAKEWAEGKDLQNIWETCHRGDWMLWLFKRANNYTLKEITLAKGHCANTVRYLMKDERSINAVDAAIKFGNGEITAKELKDKYKIKIIDNGVGIGENKLAEIKKSWETRRYKSFGMLIVLKIVEAHKGELFLDSTINKGTKVTIVLPKIIDKN